MAAVAAAASSDHSTDAFVPAHSHSFTPSSSLLAGSLWWSSVRGAGAIKATAVCSRLQNPGPPSIRQPQSSYLRGPGGKPRTLEEKYLICPLCEDQQSHKRQGRPGVRGEEEKLLLEQGGKLLRWAAKIRFIRPFLKVPQWDGSPLKTQITRAWSRVKPSSLKEHPSLTLFILLCFSFWWEPGAAHTCSV